MSTEKNRIFGLEEEQGRISITPETSRRFPWLLVSLIVIVLAASTFGGFYYLKYLKDSAEGKSKFDFNPQVDKDVSWAERPEEADIPDDTELLAAIKLYKQQYLKSARNKFFDIVQSSKDNKVKSYALVYLGILSEEEGKFEMAQEYYNKAQKYFPKNFYAYYNRARIHQMNGDFKEAISQIDLALQIKPKSRLAMILKADLLHNNLEDDAALETLQDVIEIEKDALAYYNLGIFHKQKGDLAEAKLAFLKALEAPGSPESRHKAASELGILFGKQGDYRNSEIYFERALEMHPRNPQYYYNLAYVQHLQGKKEQALSNLKKSLEYGAEKPSTYRYIARLYDQLGDLEMAEHALRIALQSVPRNTEIMADLSDILIRRSNWSDAAFYLQKIIDLSTIKPEKSDAYYNLGRVYLEIGNYEGAISALEKAYALDPKNPDYTVLLGRVYKESGQVHKSIALYKKELADNPDNVELLLALANIYYSEELYMEAEELYEAVLLRKDAEQTMQFSALYNLARIYQDQKMYEKALKVFYKAEKKATPDQLYGVLLSIAETKLAADYPGSSTFDSLQKAIALKQNAYDARLLLARAYIKDGSLNSIELAEEELTAIIEMAGDPILLSKAYTLRGIIYYKQGFANKAISDFNMALEHDPSNATAFQNKQAAERMIESNL